MDTTQLPIPFGRFELVRRIGAGGMGEVFLAREEVASGPRACVVKKVLPNLTENRSFVGRFLDEAKVAARLNHPNIARVYEMGEEAGEYYLAMEYVQGKTVSRFMHRLRQRKENLPIGLILLLGEKICDGLAYAHDATDTDGNPLQLVHRDLSPANVCISYRGEVKIIDFGASTSTLKEVQTQARVVIGNLTYMSPEQAKKKIVDRRADVYSAGVLLWELLAWHPLPQKGDPLERWRRAANPVWGPPSTHRAEVPPEVDQVILHALAKDPNDRYMSAEAFGAALGALRRRLAPDASPQALAELLSRCFDREKTIEDQVLRDIEGPGGPEAVPTDKQQILVPPTALAFEHRGIAAPAGFVPQARDEVTEPGEPSLADAEPEPEQISEARVAFLEPTHLIEEKLVREIEGVAGSGDADYHTSPYDTSGRRRFAALGAAVFAGAMAIGFLTIWLFLR